MVMLFSTKPILSCTDSGGTIASVLLAAEMSVSIHGCVPKPEPANAAAIAAAGSSEPGAEVGPKAEAAGATEPFGGPACAAVGSRGGDDRKTAAGIVAEAGITDGLLDCGACCAGCSDARAGFSPGANDGGIEEGSDEACRPGRSAWGGILEALRPAPPPIAPTAPELPEHEESPSTDPPVLASTGSSGVGTFEKSAPGGPPPTPEAAEVPSPTGNFGASS
mmetsp:Transcript_3582/g.9083  ORF Transcript_3582/g.9083 Transcript_3582/m.9083 type:complete len:221 (+) Transcript_3582:1978-2640(+)